MGKNFVIPFTILILSAIIGIYFRPLMIIDETRYIGVAWEMFDKNSFLVPLINTEPYHHKPPLLFWLIHLNWSLLGVNETSIRFIPLLFGLGSLVLTYKLYLTLWKEEKEGAKIALLLLAGTFVFAFYNSLVMFDVMLTFWVLLGILGIVQATASTSKAPFVLLALSIGFGTLTKGPVILVHLLPLILFAKLWIPNPTKQLFLGFFLSFVGGVIIALLWAIPAGIAGGEAYRDAIFWGQSANRMVKSFAHQRPLWWYLPILPLLFFPWSIYKNFWHAIQTKFSNKSVRMLLLWLGSVIFIFSLISGKQIHYLLPEIPAFAILSAHLLIQNRRRVQNGAFVGHFYLLFATALAVAYFLLHAKLTYEIPFIHVGISILLLAGVALYLIRTNFHTQTQAIQAIALSTLVPLLVFHLVLSNFFKEQNITSFAQQIATYQKKGIAVIQDKKYHNQFHFAGKLHQKILVMPEKETLLHYLKEHPKSVVITYKRKKESLSGITYLAKTSFKSKNALLLSPQEYQKLLTGNHP